MTAEPDGPPAHTKTTAPPPVLRRYTPLLLFAFALALRLWGITWALPNATRAFSYHPDESVVTGYSLRVNPLALDFEPDGFYNYGSLALLLNGLFIQLGRLTGLSPAPEGGPIPLPFYTGLDLLTARLVTAFLGAGTCVFLYATGRRLFSSAAGAAAAALLYAVAPLAVQHGHFATVDVPATFFIAGSLYFAARYLSSDAERARDLLWAGVWAGLASATKYNALLVVLAAGTAWLLRRPRGKFAGLALLAAGTAAGFLAACPGILLNPQALLSGVGFEAQHVRKGHGDVFTGTPHGLIYHAAFNLRWGLGLPLTLLTVFAAGLALARRRPACLALLAFALPYYAAVSLAEVKFARYMLPILPPLLLLVGAALTGWRKALPARVLGALTALSGAYALLFSAGLNGVMMRPDPRDQAAAFLKGQEGVSSVAFAAGPWYYSPPLGPLLQHPWPPYALQSALEVPEPRLIPAAVVQDGGGLAPREWHAPNLTDSGADAMTVSEFNYEPALRTSNPDAKAYLATAASLLPNRRAFAQPIEVFGLPLAKETDTGGLPVQRLPHDMLYTNPATVVYTK